MKGDAGWLHGIRVSGATQGRFTNRVFPIMAAVLVGALLLQGCGKGSLTEAERISAEVAIYAAVTLQLVEFDNTFGPDHRFSQILIVDHLDPDAGDATQQGQLAAGPFTDDQRSAIVASIEHLAPIRFIDSHREFIREDMKPVIPGSVIIALDPAEFDDDGATVEANLWCGFLCGISITYRVVERADGWTVTGTEGRVIIS